jgi:predicted ATPase
MYITRIAAKQFKCFKSVDVELPKLTLLTGANSSGKSSLLYALLLPLQSYGFPLYLSPNGKYVNMGDFAEMVHCNQKRGVIELDYTLQNKAEKEVKFKTSWILDPSSSLPQLKDLHAQGFSCNLSAKRLAGELGYVLNVQHEEEAKTVSKKDELAEVFSALSKALEKVTPKKPKDRTESDENLMDRLFLLKDIPDKRVPSLEKAQTELRTTSIFVTQLLGVFSALDNNLNFVSSFRLEPVRTYYQRAKAERKLGRSGENYIEQIVDWERQKSPTFRILQERLKKLGLLERLRTRHIRGGRFEINVKTDRSGIWASLTDVGFGISQFLPIAVADLQLREASTLIVAQPEIHLHPKVQATFGDYLVERVLKHKRRYIVETHSEYLLNRIRLLIVKGKIEPSEVGIYFFQCSGCEAKVHRLTFTKSGKIEGAPQDFFDTYMMDVMDIAMEAK